MNSPESAAAPTCVVFGGSGFLGRAVVRAVRGAGLRVRIATRHAPAHETGPERASGPSAAGTREASAGETGLEHVRADVRDDRDVARAVRGAFAVVNAVALYVERGGVTFEAIHVDGAARVARLAREAGVTTLVQISGLGADAGSSSKYVRARARGELAARDAFRSAVVMRPGVLFARDDAFLTSIAALSRLPVVPLFGDGATRLQPVHVDDAAAAVAAVVATQREHRLYELGGADVLTYREIVGLVMDHAGRRRPLLPVPFGVWRAGARVLGLLPSPPLTEDQIILMQHDNVVSGREATFAELDLEPAGLSRMLPQCLSPGGSR